MFETIETFLIIVGFYALSCYLYDNLRTPVMLLHHKWRTSYGNEREVPLTERFGKWAAITGSTDGIGKAYARELAQNGLNVLLISRTESKLKAVAAEIEKDFGVQTKIIVADFTKGEAVIEHIEAELGDLPVAILVNNVGQTTSEPGQMCAFTAAELWQVIYTNIGAATLLTRLFVRRMHSAGIKGAIVNVSSGTELQPIPNAALYSASKAFIRSLTLAVEHEVRPYGITVQLVSPNFVVTKINSFMSEVMRGGIFIPDATTYARWAVSTLGKTDETTGYFWHGVQTAVRKLFPWRIGAYISSFFFRILLAGNVKKL